MSLFLAPIYDIHIKDTYRNHRQFWIDREDKRALTEPLRSTEIRTRVMEQLRQISYFLPHTIQKKYYFYRQNPNNKAMQTMASMFARMYMDPLFVEAQKIQAVVTKVQSHIQQFEACLAIGNGLQATDIALIQDMYQTSQKLDQDLINLTLHCNDLKQKIQALAAETMQIWSALTPNFAALPADKTCLTKKIEALTKMEALKDQQNVEQEVKSFYVRFINAVRSLRNIEKGMISCLEKNFGIPISFKHGKLKGNDFIPERSQNTEKALAQLLCPLTKQFFKHPVILETGHSFEREQLVTHLGTYSHCPHTWTRLTSTLLIPNLSLESIAQRLSATKTQDNFFERMPAFTSPISGKPFQKPVVVSSGITYEEEEADALLTQNKNCLVMGVPLRGSLKIPNLALIELMKALQDPKAPQRGLFHSILNACGIHLHRT